MLDNFLKNEGETWGKRDKVLTKKAKKTRNKTCWQWVSLKGNGNKNEDNYT